MKKKKKHIALKVSLLTVSVGLIAGMGVYMHYANQYRDKFFKGTVINGMDVSDMTVDQVEEKIAATVEDYSYTVTFRDGSSETIHDTDIDYGYKPDGTVQSLMNQQNSIEWIKGYLNQAETEEVQVLMTYDENKLQTIVDALPEFQDSAMTAPTDAYMEYQSPNFVVVPETQGNLFDPKPVKERILEDIAKGEKTLNVQEAFPDIYAAPKVLSTDETLNKEANDLNKLIGASVTLDIPGGTYVLDGPVLLTWLCQDADGKYYKDQEIWDQKLRATIMQLKNKIDNIGQYKTFPATGLGEIQVEQVTYGYEVDAERVITEVAQELEDGAVVEHGLHYFSWETSDPSDNYGWGQTYIEIDCSRQHLWAYQNGQVAYETDIVSGAMVEGRATPDGAYMFVTKESPSTLIGKDKNGKELYKTKVKYFMPFNRMDIGIHDATWQSAFGGTRYKDGFGSHGCINVSLEAAEKLYGMITFEEPVIVYYSGEKEIKPAEPEKAEASADADSDTEE